MKIEIGKDFPQYFKPSYPEEFELFSHFEVTAGIPTVLFAITTWKENSKPNVCACVLLLAVALGVLAALAVSPESVGAQLPMLDLACRLGTAGVVYAVLLFLGMFGTSVSSLVAVLTYAGQKSARLAGHRTALLLVLTAAAFAGSLFGFGDLIGTVYPVYGYLGMAAMLLVAEHAVHARRAGKHCAATGD